MITEEIVQIKGIPQKLIVFLHGYIHNAEAMEHKLGYLYEHLDNYAVHVPQSPDMCEIHEEKRQWYSMHRFDPDDLRRSVPTIEECAKYYDRMTLGLQHAFNAVVPYMEQTMQEYGLSYSDTTLCGFSQGAMVALYTGLMAPEKLANVISFSGILAGRKYIQSHVKNTPDILLIHGTEDDFVRFSAMEYTQNELQNLGCRTQTAIIPNGKHSVTDESLQKAVDYLKQDNL